MGCEICVFFASYCVGISVVSNVAAVRDPHIEPGSVELSRGNKGEYVGETRSVASGAGGRVVFVDGSGFRK
jgi:hypothetical protein